MFTRNRAWVGWVTTLASTLDMWDVVFVAYDLKDIGVIVSFVRTEMLLPRWTRDNNGEQEVIDRPLVVFIGARNVRSQRRTTLIDKDMYFAP
jgi:hypothetical protein